MAASQLPAAEAAVACQTGERSAPDQASARLTTAAGTPPGSRQATTRRHQAEIEGPLFWTRYALESQTRSGQLGYAACNLDNVVCYLNNVVCYLNLRAFKRTACNEKNCSAFNHVESDSRHSRRVYLSPVNR
ncbi:hypothetical protein ISCGN_020511 [Ixodes scapularis]